MQDIIIDNSFLIIFLPLWIFLIIMLGRFFAVYVNKSITHVLTLLASFGGIIFSAFALLNYEHPLQQNFQFIKINNFIIDFGIYIDKLSLIFAIVLFVVSFLVQIFSISYMKEEKKSYRFFALLNLFNFAMAGLLFSPNLFQMFVFWGLVGIVSYLLIAFDYKTEIKSEAAKRVFITNAVGDIGFLGGIVFFSYYIFNYSNNFSLATLSFEDLSVSSVFLSVYASTWQFYCICGLFILAALVKSAQFPFYNWLQDAMEAKLPVSALLHSSTMVAAGVYLILRLYPMFMCEHNILAFVWVLGLFTTLICSVLASIETHPKKVLAYSTSANLGLMFFAVGMLNIKAAVIFFIAHAFIKSMLFLSIIQEDKSYNILTYVLFLVGSLSLSGILFSGMVSKELIYAGTSNNIVSIIFCCISFLTAFYLLRLSIIMLEETSLDKPRNINYIEFLPIVLLMLADIGFYIYLKINMKYELAEPFFAALVAWLVVYILYRKDLLKKYTRTPRFVAKICNNKIPEIYNELACFADKIERKVFGNYNFVLNISKAFVALFNWVEVNLMINGVRFIADSSKKISEIDKKIQLKNVQAYNAYALALLTITISFIIIVYTYILSQMN